MNDAHPKQAHGRPRDEATGPALLKAARRLVIRNGYAAVSVQQIVDEAGVAKQTFYRRWPGKADLVLDAFLESAAEAPKPAEGPLSKTLARFLKDLFENLADDGPAIRSLIAAGQDDPQFLEAFRVRFVHPRAKVVRDILESAERRGDLASDADLDVAIDALHGAFWYRLLQGEPLGANEAKRLGLLIARGLGAK